jgi:hypothetical protein
MDKVILTTGHTHNLPSDFEQQLSRFAETNGLRYLRGDSAAEMPLDDIAPGEQVGMLGLGLGFLDVLMSLTVGRGGRFEPDGEDDLRYVPSGREPHVVAGSRSGMVIRGRGRNQKEPTYRYQPVFVTDATITAARRRAQLRDGSAQLSFLRDVLPLLQLEAEHVYYANHVRRQSGPRAADRFAARHRRLADRGPAARRELLTEFGVAEIPQLNLEELGRPFQEASFSDPDAFHGHLLDLMKSDFTEASAGNVEGPMKAALDTLRDIRSTVRLAVDYGGLRSGSHEDEFLGWFNPIYAMIATGPPYFRVAQARALIKSGILTIVGPGTQVSCDRRRGQFVLESSRVRGSRRAVTTFIDARIPKADVARAADPLTRQLLADGLISEFVNTDPTTGARFHTGAIAVTRPPSRVLDRAGQPDPHLYAYGIPTENIRWFNQGGNGRPGPLTEFHTDADAIAADALVVSDQAPAPAAAPALHRR